MIRSRRWFEVVALILVLTMVRAGWSQQERSGGAGSFVAGSTAPVKNSLVCKFYQLRDFAESEELCGWIANSIPEAVAPGTWKHQSTTNEGGIVLCYPKLALLAITQTPGVHAEVAAYLQDLKTEIQAKSREATAGKKDAPRRGVRRAQKAEQPRQPDVKQTTGVADAAWPVKYATPAVAKPATAVRTDPGYPLPVPLQQPKHLFHFIVRFEGSGMETTVSDLTKKLGGDAGDTAKEESSKTPLNQLLHFIIRYEGDGIIDSNVVEFMKVLQKMQTQDEPRTRPAAGDPLVGEQQQGPKPTPFPTVPNTSYSQPSAPARPASFEQPPSVPGYSVSRPDYAPGTSAGPAATPAPFSGSSPAQSTPTPKDNAPSGGVPSMPSIGVPVSPFAFPTAPRKPSRDAATMPQSSTLEAKPGTAPSSAERVILWDDAGVVPAGYRNESSGDGSRTPRMPLPD